MSDKISPQDFIKGLRSQNTTIKKAAGKAELRSGVMSDEEILNKLGLEDGDSSVVDAKLNAVTFGKDKNQNPYFSFQYTILEGKARGSLVSEYYGLVERGKLTVELAYELLLTNFLRFGFETDGWGIEELVDGAQVLSQDKPTIRLSVKNNQGRMRLRVLELLDDAPTSAKASAKEEADPEVADSESDSTEPDPDDPNTWAGFTCKYKAPGSKRAEKFDVVSFSRRTKMLKIQNNSSSFDVSPEAVELV
jgi:hypothetical protein